MAELVDSYSASSIARDVYSWILQGNNGLNGRRSAEALHKAVRDLRNKTRIGLGARKESDPLVWASYIHVGI